MVLKTVDRLTRDLKRAALDPTPFKMVFGADVEPGVPSFCVCAGRFQRLETSVSTALKTDEFTWRG